jgi:D-glycerate 3-kinase
MMTTVDICNRGIKEFLSKYADAKRPLVVGIQGVQGIGKTTLVAGLSSRLIQDGLKVVTFSIDDLYYSKEELENLYLETQNPLYIGRGVPGTHDAELGSQILTRLKSQQPASVPKYNKALFNGKGDRESREKWSQYVPPYDVVLIEGWCLGYQALGRKHLVAKLSSVDLRNATVEHILDMNERLKQFDSWLIHIDLMVYLLSDVENVLKWRWQQEQELIKRHHSGMTKDELKHFLNRFLLCYDIYYQKDNQAASLKIPYISIYFDRERSVVKEDSNL